MIPITLTLTGFLSYRDPVEIDFTSFNIACISGPNGSGKSSLLDAITWALFGQARRRDDAVINTRSDAAEVVLTFAYEDNVYRVQRRNPRGKTTLLEFHILQSEKDRLEDEKQPSRKTGEPTWKPLTERTLRETQAVIENTLRLDYETFTNAAFFLQGKADQFTQQRASDRKRILGTILGLEVWERYRGRAGERRREVQAQIDVVDGRMQEIDVELEEEAERIARLEQLETELTRLSQTRATQETTLENMRLIAATLQEQRRLVDTLARQLDTARQAVQSLEARLVSRGEERDTYAESMARAAEIEAAYEAWQTARGNLERWEEIAAQFREQETHLRDPLTEIETARAYLEAEETSLLQQSEALKATEGEIPTLKSQLAEAQSAAESVQKRVKLREGLERELNSARTQKADALAENPRLKAEMEELKERIDQLTVTEGAICPLCGQPLSQEERQTLIEELTAKGGEMGDRFRANRSLLEKSDQHVRTLETQLGELAQEETALQTQFREIDQYAARLSEIQKQVEAWEKSGLPRLAEIRQAFEKGSYAPEARAKLAEIDTELEAIGYDPAAHDAARSAEAELRPAEISFHQLEKARAALAPLVREIEDLETQIKTQADEVTRQQTEYDQAAADLAAAEAQAPDVETAERELFQLQEAENRTRLEVGAARQKVLVLDDLKDRREGLTSEREALTHQVGLYKQLERAFGKDGVPALLIEQALPQIETKANEILDRLSTGTMSVRFVTQAAYRDKRRSDLRETLDIQISDSAGTREYEMYSGGEAFRVNFAIRLALAEVLAQRAGARLQTLVIDEGFGSQDAAGRQRLIEAINMVRPDFAKILVITHIDELRDAFPTRIEVEKTAQGSVVQVV